MRQSAPGPTTIQQTIYVQPTQRVTVQPPRPVQPPPPAPPLTTIFGEDNRKDLQGQGFALWKYKRKPESGKILYESLPLATARPAPPKTTAPERCDFHNQVWLTMPLLDPRRLKDRVTHVHVQWTVLKTRPDTVRQELDKRRANLLRQNPDADTSAIDREIGSPGWSQASIAITANGVHAGRWVRAQSGSVVGWVTDVNVPAARIRETGQLAVRVMAQSQRRDARSCIRFTLDSIEVEVK